MTLSLAARWPGTEALPRVELCDLPTPLEPLTLEGGRLRENGGLADLAVKRDDLTSTSYGGNKVRKLELLLGQAVDEGRRAVVTFGAYGSNHALATAVHATALGIEPHVVLSPQEPGPFSARVLRAHAGIGTCIHPVAGWDGTEEAARVREELRERDGIAPLAIPMGGSNARGATAYVNAALELIDQSDEAVPDVVYVAGGTLGTAAGLAIGFAAGGAPTRVTAVRVTPEEVANEAFAARLAGDVVSLLLSTDERFPALEADELALDVRHDWFEPGYGVVTPETTEAVASAYRVGLTAETTYTGKALAALARDARSGRLAGKRVLYWHTYNSAPLPSAGPDELLPEVLQDYVAECDRRFGGARSEDGGTSETFTEGDRE